MAQTLKQLKTLWNHEKLEYRSAEIGSGVQIFVKEIFKCEELFNLKSGKLSTEDLKRKNEFLEEARKKGKRADVVVFIDSDIIVPVEVEKYGNIKAGINQIFGYQADWTKKYGLLTDGNEWRFYNNTFLEKTFFIDKILEDPTDFLTFWKEYITPEYYYRSFFEKKGQLKFFEETFPKIDNVREEFFNDITKLIENFKNKLNLKGYFKKEKDETEKNKKAVEITYAYLIQFILYKTLVDNNFPDFNEDWKERIKSIDKAIKAEIYGEVLKKIKDISKKISDKIYKRFSDEQESINEKLEKILEQPKQDVNDVSVWLDILLFINRYDFSNVENEIFGYVYENYLKDLYLDEKKGQYFTDPNVVDFMLNEMGYTKSELKKRYEKNNESISIIDPSCGSGTFLYNSTARIVETFFDGSERTAIKTEQIINENIFGLDIAEFPLYLAEMNILMRMLPIVINQRYNNPVDQKIKVFKTRDSIAEFLDTSIKNTISDINTAFKKGKIQYDLFSNKLDLEYDSFMRDKRDLADLKESLEIKNKKLRCRFDFVIGNPPYVSYNESSTQHLLFFDLIKERKVKLNDVYGVNLHSVPNHPKKGRPNPNLYLFFMALGIALLKDRGVISYIIPQNLLTAGDFDVMRYHLSKFTTILKIITFRNALFVGRGITQKNKVATSSLIFIVEKSNPLPNNQVEVISYENSNQDVKICMNDLSRRKNVIVNKVSQKQLLKNYRNWNFIKFDKFTIEFLNYYNQNTEDLNFYYQHTLANMRFKSKFYFDGGYSIDESKRLYKEPEEPYYIYPKFLSNTFTHILPNGYWPNERKKTAKHFIALRQGNQEYNLLDSTYKIIWSYANPSKFYFTDQKIIWARNQFNGIGSENYEELLYLFALLNSPLNFKILIDNVKSENEMDILFSITSIKNFIRTPIIDISNELIKEEIILHTKELISMEKQILSDIIDLKGIMQQKFDKIVVQNNHFIISYKEKTIKATIIKEHETVSEIVNSINKLGILDNGIGTLNDLKNISAFDHKFQKELKDYIDILVFSLYFKVKLAKLGFVHKKEIEQSCSKNKFFILVNK